VEFRFRALAALVGKLPLGGPRELALASLVSARLASDALGDARLPAATRRARALAARQWCIALALPAALRHPVLRLIDASAADDSGAIYSALEDVVSLAAPSLDPPARSELRRLLTSPAI